MLHISNLNYHEHATLSLSPPVCIYSHVLFLLLINALLVSLLSVSLWKFIPTEPTDQGLVTGRCPWWPSGQDSALSLPQPDFNLWERGTESCFKLPQAEATQDHFQLPSVSQLTSSFLGNVYKRHTDNFTLFITDQGRSTTFISDLLPQVLGEQCTNIRATPSMSGQGQQRPWMSYAFSLNPQALLTQQHQIKESKGRMNNEKCYQVQTLSARHATGQ